MVISLSHFDLSNSAKGFFNFRELALLLLSFIEILSFSLEDGA